MQTLHRTDISRCSATFTPKELLFRLTSGAMLYLITTGRHILDDLNQIRHPLKLLVQPDDKPAADIASQLCNASNVCADLIFFSFNFSALLTLSSDALAQSGRHGHKN